jgi:hypothetical protein
VPPVGLTHNPFTVYRDWEVIPERWNRKPTVAAGEVPRRPAGAVIKQIYPVDSLDRPEGR